jgi:hypothetical protein
MRIAFIGCSKDKLKGNMPARKLYSKSRLFNKCLAYSEKYADKTCILSAKYGLISPDEKISDYDLTFKDKNRGQKIIWAIKVKEELAKIVSKDDIIILLTGKEYSKYIRKFLNNKIEEPLKGLGIGDRLRYLKFKI